LVRDQLPLLIAVEIKCLNLPFLVNLGSNNTSLILWSHLRSPLMDMEGQTLYSITRFFLLLPLLYPINRRSSALIEMAEEEIVTRSIRETLFVTWTEETEVLIWVAVLTTLEMTYPDETTRGAWSKIAMIFGVPNKIVANEKILDNKHRLHFNPFKQTHLGDL